MANQNIGLRIESSLLAALDALAVEQGTTRTAIIIDALHSRLGVDSKGSVEQRLTAVEQRLAIVEGAQQLRPAPNTATPTPTPKHPRQDGREGASPRPQVSQHPTESHPRADGGRWLSTADAVALSSSRNGPSSVASLKRWGEDGRIEAIGLRYCPHGTKRNDLASFEDLRFG